MTVWTSPDGAGFQPAAIIPAPSTSGETLDPLQAGARGRWDRGNTLRVRLYGGLLTSVSDARVLAGANAAAVQNSNGDWEVLQFANAELVDSGTYKLSRLLRGQAGSDYAITDVLPPGAPFVLLDTRLVPLAKGLNALDRPILVRFAAAGRASTATAGASKCRSARTSKPTRSTFSRATRSCAASHAARRKRFTPMPTNWRISARRRAACTSAFRNVRHCRCRASHSAYSHPLSCYDRHTDLGLPYIDGSQAQKHVTHNEALRILDAAIQIGVLDLTLTAPPSSPVEGERHVVASGATGAWAGQDDTIATWQDGAWAFLPPKTGWCIWSEADSGLFVFDGAAWQSAGGPSALDNLAHLGVNTAASSPNLLAVKSNAALFAAIDAADGGTGDMQLQVSKEAPLTRRRSSFRDNFSGRAEFGLIGADTFKLKVSPDGSSWTEAFTIDQGSGNISLPRGLPLTGVVSPAQIPADQDDYARQDLRPLRCCKSTRTHRGTFRD